MIEGDEPQEGDEGLFGPFDLGRNNVPSDPITLAREGVRRQLPKRFYDEVSIGQQGDCFHILLDGRAVKSPAKNVVEVPVSSLAEALAEEWRAQKGVIDPSLMPLTRLLNSAIDGVQFSSDAVRASILSYLDHDYICYPADYPQELVDRQNALWLPVLEWAGGELGGRFLQSSGVFSVEQDRTLAKILEARLRDLCFYRLCAIHSLTTLTGSALLAFALWQGFLDRDSVWQAANIDEDWNSALWGEDEEVKKRQLFRKADFDAAALVLTALC